jgi:hypothetical protein
MDIYIGLWLNGVLAWNHASMKCETRMTTQLLLPVGNAVGSCIWRSPCWLPLAAAVIWSSVASAQVDFEQPPIDYLKAQPDDPVSKLQVRIDAGDVQLHHAGQAGYLRSVLEALSVPVSSQTLVFSKTSFQLRRISPRTPRAVYFGDDVYVGWVRGGDVMEFSTVDPKLGANFYTLSQEETARPQFRRHTHECLQCHGSSLTRGVPGHLVRSVYAGRDGHPILSARTFLTDQSSPLNQRWGGWYVTGRHGAQRHLGNLIVGPSDTPEDVKTDKGANVVSLSKYCDTSVYLSGHSDIVALMVLEHQSSMHNLITKANFVARIALRDQQVINEMLERPEDYRSESTNRRIQSVVESVLQHLLFADEIVLTDTISGTSDFAREFATSGAHDSNGRSLRQFDLQRRLFKYPCSYLIYSEAFDELPEFVKDKVYRRLWDVLTDKDTTNTFRHLSCDDRKAILEILRDTKPGLPDYWRGT